jgi:hypothetical protein
MYSARVLTQMSGPVLNLRDLSLIDAEDFGELQLRHLLRLAQFDRAASPPDSFGTVSQFSAANQVAWLPAIHENYE